MTTSIQFPFPQFFDTDGDPLDAGYVYVGEVGQDPETHPIALFWDEALTIPAAQPLRTRAGYISRSGTPARVYVSQDDYSMTVRSSRRVLVLHERAVAASMTLRDDLLDTAPGKGASLVSLETGISLQEFANRYYAKVVYVDDKGAKGDWNGTTGTDDTTAIRAAFADIKAAGGGKVVFTAGKNYRVTGYVGTDANTPADLIHFCRVEGFGATLTLNANATSTDALCLEGRGNEVHGLTVNSTRTIDHNANLTPQRTPYQYGIVIGGKGHLQSPRSLGSLSDFVSGALVRGCAVTNFNLPVHLFRAADATVEHSTVDQFTDTGILVDDCTTNISIRNNRVTRGGDDCIFARHYPNSPWATAGNYIGGLRIERNWCQYSFGKGAGGGGYSDATISDNDILDVWAGGVNWEVEPWVSRDTGDNARIHITKNRVTRPGRYWGVGKLKAAAIGNNQDCGIHTFYNNAGSGPLARHLKITDNIIVNPYRDGIAIKSVVGCEIERNKVVSGTWDHGAGSVSSVGAAFVTSLVANQTIKNNAVDTDLSLVAGQNAFTGGTFSIANPAGRVVVCGNEIAAGVTSWSNSPGTATQWDVDQDFVTYTTDATTANVVAFQAPDLSAAFSRMRAVAVQSGGSNRAWYEKHAQHYRNGAGAVQQAAGTVVEQESNAAWDAAFSTSGSNILSRVTGAAGQNITWRVSLDIRCVA